MLILHYFSNGVFRYEVIFSNHYNQLSEATTRQDFPKKNQKIAVLLTVQLFFFSTCSLLFVEENLKDCSEDCKENWSYPVRKCIYFYNVLLQESCRVLFLFLLLLTTIWV